jgi:hypothetical protein
MIRRSENIKNKSKALGVLLATPLSHIPSGEMTLTLKGKDSVYAGDTPSPTSFMTALRFVYGYMWSL